MYTFRLARETNLSHNCFGNAAGLRYQHGTEGFLCVISNDCYSHRLAYGFCWRIWDT